MPTPASLFVHYLLHRHFLTAYFTCFIFLSFKHIFTICSLLSTVTTGGPLDAIVPFISCPHRQCRHLFPLKQTSLPYPSIDKVIFTSNKLIAINTTTFFIVFLHYLFYFIVSKIFLRYFLNLSADVLLSFFNTLSIKILFSVLCLMFSDPLKTLLLA